MEGRIGSKLSDLGWYFCRGLVSTAAQLKRVYQSTDLGLSLVRGILLRKEVIQPHLPVQLPCYDFVPVIGFTLGACLPDKSGLAQRLQALPTSMT